MKHLRIILSLLCLGLILPASAQEAAPINIRFRPYPLIGSGWEGLFYQNGDGKMNPVSVLNNRAVRSPEHRYSGAGPLRFYRFTENEEGVQVPSEVASVALEPGNGEYLMLLAKPTTPPPDGREFQVIKMKDDYASFPTNKLVFFNAYPEPLYIAFANERLKLMPGQFSSAIALTRVNERGFDIQIFTLDNDGQPLSLYSTRWRFAADNRELMILYRAPNSAKLMISQISQSR